MKIQRVYGSFLPRLLGARAFVFYPWIIFKHDKQTMAANPADTKGLFRHEWQHVIQVRRVGWLRFYASYLWQQITVGYRDNKWEVEARANRYSKMPEECARLFHEDFPAIRTVSP